jgi:hypothetical protein
MSTTNSWVYATIPVAAGGGTKVFNRVITSRTDAGRYYEKRGEESHILLPPGVMLPYGGTTAPGGYLLCNGVEVYRDAFPDLFAAIGTRYGEGNGTTTFNVPALSGPSTGGLLSVEVGYAVDKDMSDESIPELPGGYSPNGVGVSSGTTNASFWDDWDNDIFDSWGYFYIYDPTTNGYHFLVLNDINLADGVMATQIVAALGRTFSIVHGYCARGIYRMEVTCTSDANPFQFGAYGNMGSDSGTINTNIDATLTVGGTDYSFSYNRNVEEGDDIEKFYAYFVPFEPSEMGAYNKHYIENVDGDNLFYYTRAFTHGVTVYFAKKNDVITFVNADLRLLSGKVRGGAISLNSNGDPELGTSSSYIIKC